MCIVRFLIQHFILHVFSTQNTLPSGSSLKAISESITRLPCETSRDEEDCYVIERRCVVPNYKMGQCETSCSGQSISHTCIQKVKGYVMQPHQISCIPLSSSDRPHKSRHQKIENIVSVVYLKSLKDLGAAPV